MKRNILKKAISLLLVMAMLMPLASPAFAAEAAEESGVALYGEELLGIDANDAARQLAESLGTTALNQLGGGAVVQSLAGFGMNQAMNAIFGAGQSDTEAILEAIAALSTKLDGISNKLGQLQTDIKITELNAMLNSYREFLTKYNVMYDRLQAKQKEYANNPAMTKELLLRIYDGKDANYRIDGNSFIILTSYIKGKLLEVKEVDGKKCNVFGAFDILDKYKNQWEHQGYADRKAFRGAAIALYCGFAAMTKLACIAKMEDSLSKGDRIAYDEAKSDLAILMAEIQMVKKMSERCAVIEHPDLRIFRDIAVGSDLYAFKRDIGVSHVYDDVLPEWDEFFFEKTKGNYMYPMTHTMTPRVEYRRGGAILRSNQPGREIYEKIIDSYPSDIDLFDLFFTQLGFRNTRSLPKGTRFLTDYYIYSHWQAREDAAMQEWKTEAFQNNGELEYNIRLAQQVSREYLSEHRYRNPDLFFDMEMYKGLIRQGDLSGPAPTPIPHDELISGMDSSYELPYSDSVILSVEEKTGATYRWFVNKNDDDGFQELENETNASYALPILEACMNGWMYRCAVIEDGAAEDKVYTLADPVTLVLTGADIPEPVTEHEVGSAEELGAALDKITDGSWDGHTLKLTEDIKYQQPMTLSGHSVTIDLNGHNLGIQPDKTVEPNINPMSDKPEIAAIYVNSGSLIQTGEGELNAFAPEGVAYGVYAGENAQITVHNAITTNGGTAVYAADGGVAEIKANAGAEGEDSHAVQCFDGGSVTVSGDVAATGKASCGVYADSSNGIDTMVMINGDITVSGDNSQGALTNAENTYLQVEGNVTVTGSGASGVTASGGDYSDGFLAWIYGDVTASDAVVYASSGAGVRVSGNVTSSAEGASAIYAVGGSVTVDGNVTATGINGTAISAGKWDLIDPAVGAFVMVDGKITAYTPLRIESLPVGENEHTGQTAVFGHYIYTDGTNTVWAYDENFVSTNPNAQAPSIITHPQSKTVEPGNAVTLTISAKVSDGGTLSYQWYSNTTDDLAGSTLIDGATNASYTPHTDTVGTTYYYVIITNTNESAQGDKTAQAISSLAAVKIGDIYKVEADIAALSIGYAPGDSAAAVTQNVSLTVTGAVYGSSITWTSSNTTVISDSGVVTRPGFTSGDAAVIVTASVYNNGASGTRSFDLIVLKLPQKTYTVTFDKNGGDTEASPAAKEVISGGNVGTLPTAPTRSGYTFNGWNTQANGSGTAFTAAMAVTDSITVYAQWSRNSSGGGEGSPNGSGGTTTPVEKPKTETNVAGNTATATTTVIAAVDSSGNVAAIVSRAQVSDAISKAMEEAEKQGEGTVARVEIKLEASSDATSTEISIPKEAVSQTSEAGIGALAISTPVASITFDANVLSALSEEAAGDLKITTSKVEASSLSPEAQRAVGDRPVFDFSVTSGGKTISQFGGEVSVSVPYIPKEDEDTNAIVIYFINDSGELEVVSNCIYDPATGRVSFSTRHFSKYAVGYNKINFKDVAESAWYSKAVGFIAAREITTGTGGGNFSPEAKLTRGQFLVMLMKAYGIAPEAESKDNFADAGATYYSGYMAAAKRLSISNGVGNNMFVPEKEITRQEMFTLLYNALKAIGRLPEGTAGKPLSSFADAESVASWANEAMTLLVETGTISGNGGKLSPTSTTTRAEMAQVLYNLLSAKITDLLIYSTI